VEVFVLLLRRYNDKLRKIGRQRKSKPKNREEEGRRGKRESDLTADGAEETAQ
jgi:hypothetical protein